MRLISTLLALGLATGTAQAAVLDFSGTICNGGGACGNGSLIDQSYGDIAGQVDVIYDANRDTAALDNLRYWGGGYETLTDVAFSISGFGMSIVFDAAAGYDVSVTGFDIAPYLNRVRNTSIRVIDMFDDSVLFDTGIFEVSTAGVTSFAGSWMSSTGILLEFGPDSWDVGIDNIQYSAEATMSPIPLPAGGLLLAGALFGLGIARRRKSS